MRKFLSAFFGAILYVAATAPASSSPLVRSDRAVAQSAGENGVTQAGHKPKHIKNRDRHYGWHRGKHKGWQKREHWQRERPRCMIEPWLCR